MAHTLTAEQIRALSDDELEAPAWRVEAEQGRRRRLRQPRSFIEDIRARIPIMDYRWWALWANLGGTLLLLATRVFESGNGYFESGLLPYPRVGSALYWIGLVILLFGFGLQFFGARRDRRKQKNMVSSLLTQEVPHSTPAE